MDGERRVWENNTHIRGHLPHTHQHHGLRAHQNTETSSEGGCTAAGAAQQELRCGSGMAEASADYTAAEEHRGARQQAEPAAPSSVGGTHDGGNRQRVGGAAAGAEGEQFDPCAGGAALATAQVETPGDGLPMTAAQPELGGVALGATTTT